MRVVRVHLPLKQGLRHKTGSGMLAIKAGTSASSIKTRIKTEIRKLVSDLVECVRVHLPLKQGLRPHNHTFSG